MSIHAKLLCEGITEITDRKYLVDQAIINDRTTYALEQLKQRFNFTNADCICKTKGTDISNIYSGQ